MADYLWRVVVDKNDIDTAIGQNPMPIDTWLAGNDLYPEAQEMGGKLRKNRELPVIRKSLLRIHAGDHLKTEAARHGRPIFYI
jgi:hypothetical protein